MLLQSAATIKVTFELYFRFIINYAVLELHVNNECSRTQDDAREGKHIASKQFYFGYLECFMVVKQSSWATRRRERGREAKK